MSQYNVEEVKRLLALVKGDRSNRRFAEMAGISYTSIGKIERGEYKITAKMIASITEAEAYPQNGVTANDLMVAAGYIDEHQVAKMNSSREKEMKDALQSILFEKMSSGKANISFNNEMKEKHFSPDIAINVGSYLYCIDFKSFDGINDAKALQIAENILAKYIFTTLDYNRVISLVVDSTTLYEKLASLSGNYCYNGNLEVLLLDMKDKRIAGQQWLSKVNNEVSSLLFG